MAMRKIVENVGEFLDRASKEYGLMKAQHFSQEMFCNLLEVGVESPIEDMFWIAANALCASEFLDVNPGFRIGQDGKPCLADGIYIKPQARIGKFRADFLISQVGIGPDEHLRPVVVELDGHDFHDKDKHQRSYEKARDRNFVKQGFQVLHFTGSDVVKDPFEVAYEALDLVGCFCGTARGQYTPNDPLAIGK